ncbi:unnamed protein product [Diatraea saccharalis]|uniref:Uncharacterized protein n=1 Tax=Diatraea saccharalis TaxID=40085 RepID=A0A9N9WI45_9NEOP|nr:unnamed protein product [Diatraea saccharalis]
MDARVRACVLFALCFNWFQITAPYNIRNHPCCLDPNDNLTLAMIIDAFEIYGHDPTDKLDNLWLYQNEMLRVKTAEDQVLLITLDDVIDNMLTMYENHNSVAAERKATYTGGPVPMEFYLSQVILEGCLFMYPPNYGSIAGKSYLDTVELHDDRFTCNAAGGNKGLYWYPQWMGAIPHHPYPSLEEQKDPFESGGPYYPHQKGYDAEDDGDKK